MSKYKICPSCETQNDPRNMECEHCGCDLMVVPVMDSSIEYEPEINEKSEIVGQLIRVCTCGEHNPSQARKCQKCGEDISDIIPTAASCLTSEAKIPKYQLVACNGSYSYTIPCGNVVLGREHEMREWLSTKPYVSRIHAKLICDDDGIFLENLSGTNYTYVNNIRIPDGKTRLAPGDVISFGGLSIEGEMQKEAAFMTLCPIEAI